MGARKINNIDDLRPAFSNESDLIIQEFMNGTDIDVDVYVDYFSKVPVSIFSKKKIETKIGGATQTISFIDDKLIEFIEFVVSKFDFYGPVDIDLFYVNGCYYLTEINPRFGAAYIHASGCGVDFGKLLINNARGNENKREYPSYKEGVYMLAYSSAVITDMQNENIRTAT